MLNDRVRKSPNGDTDHGVLWKAAAVTTYTCVSGRLASAGQQPGSTRETPNPNAAASNHRVDASASVRARGTHQNRQSPSVIC